MILVIILVSLLLFALFIVAAVAGNRAQTRIVEQEAAARVARKPAKPPLDGGDAAA